MAQVAIIPTVHEGHPTKQVLEEIREQISNSTTHPAAQTEGEKEWKLLLVRSLPQQLEAVFGENDPFDIISKVKKIQIQHGAYIDPHSNWFTRNIKKMGGNFDYTALCKSPDQLAKKFDALAPRYDIWSVGNCSRVEQWVTCQAQSHFNHLRNSSVLDVCCGVGLMSHQLRLCRYTGSFVGVDISPTMIEYARKRQVYQETHVIDVNKGLPFSDGQFDLVICTGALELLDQDVVLAHFSRVLGKEGRLWASFQAENPEWYKDGTIHPTAHQNVYGITYDKMLEKLSSAGFDVVEYQLNRNAFCTPSPSKDGSLLPVPYHFVHAKTRK